MPRPETDVAAPAILSWAEVSRTHRVRNGVYHRAGRLVSLLTDFGLINACYPDHRDEGDPDTILYVGAGRWELTGYWRVAAARHEYDERERRMLWRFTLKKATVDD